MDDFEAAERTGAEIRTEFEELYGLLDSDIYTDAPEYQDRVARIHELLPRVKFNLESLAESFVEALAAANALVQGPRKKKQTH